MLLEIRSTGSQTIVPPSIHPGGEPYGWESFEPAATVTAESLQAAVARVAAATHLVTVYPEKGLRHDFSLALSGALANAEWGADDLIHFVKCVAQAANDEECDDRVAAAISTLKKHESEKPITGFPTLGKIIGETNTDVLIDWLELGSDQETAVEKVISELNAHHAIVSVGGSVCILNEVTDPHTGNRDVTYSRRADFCLRYANRKIEIPGGTPEKPQRIEISKYWLEHPQRRQYDSVVFAPSGTAPTNYNLWRGFTVAPKKGSCERYLGHVRKVICSGCETMYRYVTRWMAHLVQQPTLLPERALLLRGRQGTGKNVFADNFGRLLGQHYMPLTSMSQLVGRFNGHLAEVLLVYANEALWGGNRQSEGALKAMISDQIYAVEPKYRDITKLPNFKRVIIGSNEQWAAPVDLDDRRFLVLDVPDVHKEDHTYFKAIYDEMHNGGFAALLYELQHIDLTDFDVRKVPISPFGWDLKLRSMQSVPAFWYERLRDADDDNWAAEIQCTSLYEAYLSWCEPGRRFRPETAALFGKDLRKLVPQLAEKKKQIHHPFPSRKRFYCLPDLAVCRAAFEQIAKSGPEIWKL